MHEHVCMFVWLSGHFCVHVCVYKRHYALIHPFKCKYSMYLCTHSSHPDLVGSVRGVVQRVPDRQHCGEGGEEQLAALELLQRVCARVRVWSLHPDHPPTHTHTHTHTHALTPLHTPTPNTHSLPSLALPPTLQARCTTLMRCDTALSRVGSNCRPHNKPWGEIDGVCIWSSGTSNTYRFVCVMCMHAKRV